MTPLTLSRIAGLVAAVLLLPGCGGSISVDGDGISVNKKTLDVAEVPFTLEYPTDFSSATDESVKKLKAAAVVGSGEQSYIAVRRNGSEPMSLEDLAQQGRVALGNDVLDIERLTASEIDMVALTVDDSARGAAWRKLHAFSLPDSTWIIECRAAKDDMESMGEACDQALGSIEER